LSYILGLYWTTFCYI